MAEIAPKMKSSVLLVCLGALAIALPAKAQSTEPQTFEDCMRQYMPDEQSDAALKETVAFCRVLEETEELIEYIGSEAWAEEIERKTRCYEAMGRADPALFAQLWAAGCE